MDEQAKTKFELRDERYHLSEVYKRRAERRGRETAKKNKKTKDE